MDTKARQDIFNIFNLYYKIYFPPDNNNEQFIKTWPDTWLSYTFVRILSISVCVESAILGCKWKDITMSNEYILMFVYNFSKSMLKSAHMYVECFILGKPFKKISIGVL